MSPALEHPVATPAHQHIVMTRGACRLALQHVKNPARPQRIDWIVARHPESRSAAR